MPIDTDGQTITQWLLAVFGIGGGGYKLVTHETRIARLEEDRKSDLHKLDRVITVVAGMDAKLDAIKDKVDQNGALYVRRRRQRIVDTGEEVED